MAGRSKKKHVPPKVSDAASKLAQDKSTKAEKTKAGKTLREHQERG